MCNAASLGYNPDAPFLIGGQATLKRDGRPMTMGDAVSAIDALFAEDWVKDWLGEKKKALDADTPIEDWR